MADPWSQFPDAPGVTVAPAKLAFDPWGQFPDVPAPGATPNLPSSQAAFSPGAAPPADSDDGRSFELRRPEKSGTSDESWGQWIKNTIVGRQDPEYANVPSIFSQNRALLSNPTGSAALLGASDDQMHDVIKKTLGDRYIDTIRDANDYPIIRYKDPKGNPTLGYVNRPGLDTEDVARGVRGALPYALAGEVVGPLVKGLPLVSRALGWGGLGGGMSVTGDAALKPLGSEQGVDPDKALTMTLAGPAGEIGTSALASAYRHFVAIPRYFDKSTNQLTLLGRQAAQSMGLDPDQLVSDAAATFGRTYAMNPAEAKSAVDAGNFDFDIPASRGQLAKDPQQLLQEKAMRSGVYGLDAKNQIEDLDTRQTAALKKAVTETIPARMTGQPLTRSGRPPEAYGNVIGTNLADARANAKVAEKAAWDAAPDITPLPGATDLIPQAIGKRLKDFGVFDEINTPTAFRMGQQIQSFMQGEAPTTSLDATLGINRPQTIDAMRRQLSELRGNAQTPSDKAAASAIYHGYNDWIDQAAHASLLTGDPIAAANLRAARDVSAEINQIFRPTQNGQLTPGGKILQSIAKNSETPERIVSTLIEIVSGDNDRASGLLGSFSD